MLVCHNLENLVDCEDSAGCKIDVVAKREFTVADSLLISPVHGQVNIAVPIYDSSDDINVLRVQFLYIVGTISCQVHQLTFINFQVGLICYCGSTWLLIIGRVDWACIDIVNSAVNLQVPILILLFGQIFVHHVSNARKDEIHGLVKLLVDIGAETELLLQ